MRKLKYVKLFENFMVNEDKYYDDMLEEFTNNERETLNSIGFTLKSKGIAQIGDDRDVYQIYKYDLKSSEGKNRIILHRGEKNFGEYGQFEVTGADSSFEKRSFDYLVDAYNHILRHKRSNN
jgi:hypothetical protein